VPAQSQITSSQARRQAAVALVIACAAWGGSFTWAKEVMAGINQQAGRATADTFGVLLLLSWRFGLAGVIWLLALPSARRGWTWKGVTRVSLLGAVFTAAMIAQQAGLSRTTEAVSAFLTSLSILFVPLILTVILRKPPPASLWIGVALALAGIWLMTGATPQGFGLGEILGSGSSILFSIEILLLNVMIAKENASRVTGGKFLVVSVLCLLAAAITYPRQMNMQTLLIPLSAALRFDLILLTFIATLLAFGLQSFFQPKIYPTRAAMIYLTEPIFAAALAWMWIGRSMSATAIAGAILILAANGLAEWIELRKRNAVTRLGGVEIEDKLLIQHP
jgi:drug/metabolite transporter (DMT)-like permease